VKGEHDQLKRKMTDSLGEVEMLRNLIQQLKVQQEQFSNTLSTITSEMETAARNAQRFVDTSMPRVPVRATQADPLSRRRAPNLPEPSRHAQAAE